MPFSSPKELPATALDRIVGELRARCEEVKWKMGADDGGGGINDGLYRVLLVMEGINVRLSHVLFVLFLSQGGGGFKPRWVRALAAQFLGALEMLVNWGGGLGSHGNSPRSRTHGPLEDMVRKRIVFRSPVSGKRVRAKSTSYA